MTDKSTRHGRGPAIGRSYWEEAGTLWLWAWPDLLKWNQDLVWLLSPVSGEKEPFGYGDLWGVDRKGQLIIVETKRKAGASAFSKFKKFEKYFANNSVPAEVLFSRWQKKYTMELAFIDRHLANLKKWRPEKNISYPGIIPYSRKRLIVRRWHDVYSKKVVPYLKSKKRYLDKVYAYVKGRRTFSKPVYIGLSVVPAGELMEFTQKEKGSLSNLKKIIGSRVRGVLVQGKPLGPDHNRWVIASKKEP